MPAQGYQPPTGDPPDDKRRKLGDILGTEYFTYPDPRNTANSKTLDPRITNSSFEDLMQFIGFHAPGSRPQNPLKLSAQDVTDLKDAIVAKTGWVYFGPPSACCCCIG